MSACNSLDRSLGRVSVPVWLAVLTDQLPVIGSVGRYPTDDLMGRRPLPPPGTGFLTVTGERMRG